MFICFFFNAYAMNNEIMFFCFYVIALTIQHQLHQHQVVNCLTTTLCRLTFGCYCFHVTYVAIGQWAQLR